MFLLGHHISVVPLSIISADISPPSCEIAAHARLAVCLYAAIRIYLLKTAPPPFAFPRVARCPAPSADDMISPSAYISLISTSISVCLCCLSALWKPYSYVVPRYERVATVGCKESNV
jgi:hypothetical protein